MEKPFKKTWVPVAGGILALIAGTIGFVRGLSLLVLGRNFGGAIFDFPGLSSYPSGVLSTFAIYGGIHTLRRKSWWWAFAGAVCAFFGWWILGVLAVILITLSRKDFE